jgi:hypothetical protein
MIGSLLELACVSCLLATPLPPPPPDAESAGDRIREQILDEEQDRETRVVGIGRARVSFPQQFSVAAGAIVASQPRSWDCTTVCEFRGFVFEAEPGLSGGQLSAGYAVIMGETGSAGNFLTDVYLAYGVRGALLRTWGDADLRPEDQTLAGVEGEFTVIRISFSLGLFRSVGSSTPEDDWILTGGAGWGF